MRRPTLAVVACALFWLLAAAQIALAVVAIYFASTLPTDAWNTLMPFLNHLLIGLVLMLAATSLLLGLGLAGATFAAFRGSNAGRVIAIVLVGLTAMSVVVVVVASAAQEWYLLLPALIAPAVLVLLPVVNRWYSATGWARRSRRLRPTTMRTSVPRW